MSFVPPALTFRSATWDWSRPYVAGVINVTPDSFSDGGQHLDPSRAIARAEELIRDGADLLDLGAESTRPGAEPVSASTEIERLLPVIEGLRGIAVPISVDTMKAEVASACVAAGAEVVNDVTGGAFDADMAEAAREAGAYICGHIRGSSPAQAHAREAESPGFEAVFAELEARITGLRRGGVHVIADPGLGFGKGPQANLELCKRAGELSSRLQCAVMVGASRKRFVAQLSGLAEPVSIDDRDAATIGASLAAVAGGAQLIRVHNVRAMCAALRLYRAVRAIA